MIKKIKNPGGLNRSSWELEGYLEGSEVYNSAVLYRLSTDPRLVREDYVVTEPPFRPDLVAKNYYGDEKYESYVILQAGSIQNIYPGQTLRLVIKTDIDGLSHE